MGTAYNIKTIVQDAVNGKVLASTTIWAATAGRTFYLHYVRAKGATVVGAGTTFPNPKFSIKVGANYLMVDREVNCANTDNWQKFDFDTTLDSGVSSASIAANPIQIEITQASDRTTCTVDFEVVGVIR